MKYSLLQTILVGVYIMTSIVISYLHPPDTASPEAPSPRLVLGSVVGAAALLLLTATIGGVLIRCHRRYYKKS